MQLATHRPHIDPHPIHYDETPRILGFPMHWNESKHRSRCVRIIENDILSLDARSSCKPRRDHCKKVRLVVRANKTAL